MMKERLPFKIRYVCKFLCESSENIQAKCLGLLSAEMLFKCLSNTQRLVAYAARIVQRRQRYALNGNGQNSLSII